MCSRSFWRFLSQASRLSCRILALSLTLLLSVNGWGTSSRPVLIQRATSPSTPPVSPARRRVEPHFRRSATNAARAGR